MEEAQEGPETGRSDSHPAFGSFPFDATQTQTLGVLMRDIFKRWAGVLSHLAQGPCHVRGFQDRQGDVRRHYGDVAAGEIDAVDVDLSALKPVVWELSPEVFGKLERALRKRT